MVLVKFYNIIIWPTGHTHTCLAVVSVMEGCNERLRGKSGWMAGRAGALCVHSFRANRLQSNIHVHFSRVGWLTEHFHDWDGRETSRGLEEEVHKWFETCWYFDVVFLLRRLILNDWMEKYKTTFKQSKGTRLAEPSVHKVRVCKKNNKQLMKNKSLREIEMSPLDSWRSL